MYGWIGKSCYNHRVILTSTIEYDNFQRGAVALSGSLFAKKNKSRASQSPALGVRFKYEQKQNLTERLYLIFSVLSNQTSAGCGNFDPGR